MAEEQQIHEEAGKERPPGAGADGGGRKAVIRAAAIAAASGATAFAAKKALSDRHESQSGDEGRERRRKGRGDDSLLSTVLASGWESATESLMPLLADAAGRAGEYVARSGPEALRDTLVPRFIAGFERARTGGDDD